MPTLSFSIATGAFDTSLLPEAARQVDTAAFRDAVTDFLAGQFANFGGNATIRVDDHQISVVWNADSPHSNPMEAIVQRLRDGKRPEGIQLLELLLSNRPNDPAVWYNLGIALSDAGRLQRAEECLRRAAELDPDDANIAVALGVALGRMKRLDEAIEVLRDAVARVGKNQWAHLNLGGLFLQTGRAHLALPHYDAATQLSPTDQMAWLGLAEAHRLAGNSKEAEKAYATAIRINPHSDLAEKALAGSTRLAQSGFDKNREGDLRQDAVYHCLDAMKRIGQLPQKELQNLALEIAMVGRAGFAVHDPDCRYKVEGLDGEFSGLAMVCHLYVAMQRMAPGTDIGFDLSREYEQARKLFMATT